MHCTEHLTVEGGKYCTLCGIRVTGRESRELPMSGTNMDTGIYEIDFGRVRAEFSSIDHAREAANDSFWGTDREFESTRVIKVKSTVPKDSYPFICTKCRKDGIMMVSPHDDKICIGCGDIRWSIRQ